ncbi:MAG: LysR family transcriptional regulator [Selenomonas sp.]|uniref:LysR family transcriptional regulator n=1 Tax=Selenomonas sp. TaxID=2053611 RepID=UPI0025FA235C|nr:LysR family transcriptional regulator [Selenomonas sp.]MCI6085623.1 LysR family transcriptional regulator [Selenomonas sp.]MDY4415829.1 LysR family transcriptional regulator [Selenomonas sp.]
MELTKYEIFADAAKTGNFTKTADRMGYTQPAVSRTLRLLEQELGFPLFVRQKNGVELTSSGRTILPHVLALLAQQRQLEQQVAEIQGLHVGRLTIACFASVSRVLLPHFLASFQKNFPGITVELMEGGTDDIVRWVSESVADFGIMSHRQIGTLSWLSLWRDPLVAVVPREEPFLSMEAFPVEKMTAQPFILSADGTDYDIHHMLSTTKIRPTIRFTSKDDHAIVSMVANHLGMSILPRLVVLDLAHLVHMLPLAPEFHRTLGIAYKEKSALTPAARKFIDQIVKTDTAKIQELDGLEDCAELEETE